jgi:hypothetical protein
MVMRHLTRQLHARYRSRDKALDTNGIFFLTGAQEGILFSGSGNWCSNLPSNGSAFCLPVGSPVPVPPTWALMLIGFVGFGFAARRHAQRRAAR